MKDTDTLERRGRVAASADGARDSLLLLAKLRRPGEKAAIEVRVRNLSAGGLMAELPGTIDPDAPVEIEVRGIGWIAGRVAWATEGRAGIAFDREIDPQRARKPVGVKRDGAKRAAAARS